jgi:hypothetical protein
MTRIQANVPDYLAKLAEEAAARENMTVDQIVALALSAQLSAWNVRDRPDLRAQRGDLAEFDRVLAKAQDRAPLTDDGTVD